MKSLGRLSFKGSIHFEEKMTHLLTQISVEIENSISANSYNCLLLIGGYGRGEGGVIRIDNIELPHNNLDFLFISKATSQKSENVLLSQVNTIISKYCSQVNIDFDLAIISDLKLKLTDPLVITYDMRFGHKVINGDASILQNMENFTLENIPDWDIRNLMVNRGTLLTINDLILAKKHHTMKDIKAVIKHCVKAIIGYGDALLYYNGQYHYSYAEKQRRMREQKNIDESFKKLYDEAMNFRFEPDYKKYLKQDLLQFQNSVKSTLKDIHLKCESISLKEKNMEWFFYFDTALNQSYRQNPNFKQILKYIRNLLLPQAFIENLSLSNKIKAKMLGTRGILPLLFPYVAFEVQDNKSAKILSSFFHTSSSKTLNLKRCYLEYWGKYINNNFSLEEYNLQNESS